MKIFFDSSALVKHYIQEKGSDEFNEIFRRSENMFVSIICLPEIFSALNRLKRTKLITGRQYDSIKKGVLEDFEGMTVCHLSIDVITQSIRLLENHLLRAMDALHLACSLQVQAEVFVTSDIDQAAVSKKIKQKTIQI